MTRWAKSYSIVDHKLLHGGYLQRLSHQALAVYLFYVVVGDRNGKSFYAPASIQQILRLSGGEFCDAQSQLKRCGFALILSFSRYLCCQIFPRHSFEFFI